jgi:hypothetical protein
MGIGLAGEGKLASSGTSVAANQFVGSNPTFALLGFECQSQPLDGDGDLDGGIFVLGIKESSFTAEVEFGNVRREADVGIVHHLIQIQISA